MSRAVVTRRSSESHASLPARDGDSNSIGKELVNSASQSRHTWTRTSVNFLLDTVLLATFVALLGISATIRFIFPSPSAATGWTLFGWSLDQWVDLQFAVLAAFALGILLHLMLHWTWVCGVVSTKLSKWRARPVRIDDANKTLWGVGLLILIVNLLGLILAIAEIVVHRP